MSGLVEQVDGTYACPNCGVKEGGIHHPTCPNRVTPASTLLPRLRPLDDRVVVAPDMDGDPVRLRITRLGLSLPDTYQGEPAQFGTVKAVGPGRQGEDGGWVDLPQAWDHGERTKVRVGDRVLFSKYGGVEVTDDETGETWMLIAPRDLYAVIR